LNKEFPDENEKFTQDEKEKLVAKISELQERIEKLEQDNNTQKQIELLERSRKELEKYPKKAWWLKFYNRFNSLNKGLGLLNDIGDNAMKLLEKFGA
jgi:ribosomal protein S15P/S13E